MQKKPQNKPPPKKPKQNPKHFAWCLSSPLLKITNITGLLCEVLCSQQDQKYQVADLIHYYKWTDEQIPNNSYFWTGPASPWVKSQTASGQGNLGGQQL